MDATELRTDIDELISGDDDPESWLPQAIAVLDAISVGELFAALPPQEDDRLRHQSGVVLLDMLAQRLKLQWIVHRRDQALRH